MRKKLLQYRIIIRPDTQTGTGSSLYSAFCPTLGVVEDGETIEEALHNIQGAMETYIESLIEDGEIPPIDYPEKDILTVTQILVPDHLQYA